MEIYDYFIAKHQLAGIVLLVDTKGLHGRRFSFYLKEAPGIKHMFKLNLEKVPQTWNSVQDDRDGLKTSFEK